ncbi:MAG: hypothetical protein Fur0037_21540 [Planctomycetota bacterium]
MRTIEGALHLPRKDLVSYFRDRTGVALGFLLPIGLVTVFGFVMKAAFGGGGAMPRATLWVADEDGSEASRRLARDLRRADTLILRPRQDEPPISPEDGKRMIADGDAHHVLVIEKGFGASIERQRKPPLRMLRDPGRQMEDYAVRLGLV